MKEILLIVLLIVFPNIACADIATGLVGWWKLDDGSGASAADSSGNGNTGALQNTPSWVTGQVGGALSFNGTNSNVTIASSLGLSGKSTNMTIACWFYRSALGNHGSLYKLGNNTDASGGDGFAIGVAGAGTSGYETSGNNVVALYEGARWIDSGVTVGTGWNHVAIVINSSGFPTIYLNGSSIYSDSAGTMHVIGSLGAITDNIAGYTASNAADRYFNGYVDDVRVYSRPLAAADVMQLYNFHYNVLKGVHLSHFND